jgi:aspartyl/asparaginyl beta-hydroxylase (cupin superfamily)
MGAESDQRIRQLFDAAAQAIATGRAPEAERLVRQAEAEAPRHPLVLNETARRMLLAGNPAGAHVVLEQAVKRDPSHPSLWLSLAAALRALNRPDDEMAALEKALAIDPMSPRALLQKASLQEVRGTPRAAAMTYRTALMTIPQGVEPPPAMSAVLQHAREMVDANDRALEGFIEDRLKDLRERYTDQPLSRFDRCLATLLQKRRIYRPLPNFMYFPNLPAFEFYDRSEFPWLDSIEAATDDIRTELLSVLAEGPSALEPYINSPDMDTAQWRELNRSRRWGAYFLWRDGVAIPDHQARCPKTVAALEVRPRCDLAYSSPSAVFSILDAKTRIPAHSGASNARLLVHLPLIIPPGCGFRVGAEQREWQPGKALVFDDTVEHEAWNGSDVPRAVLIFDIWNPYLSPAERELVGQLYALVGEYYGTRPYEVDHD